jgi:hypothetical protein
VLDQTQLTSVIAANEDKSLRVKQQLCALFLGLAKTEIPTKELRGLCKDQGVYNSPNFMRNMKADKHLYEGDGKSGYTLSEAGKSLAAEYFDEVPVAAVVVAPPTYVEDVEADLSGVLDAIASIPEGIVGEGYTEEADEDAAMSAPDQTPALVAQEALQATKAVTKAPAVAKAPEVKFTRMPKVRGGELLAGLFDKIQAEAKAKKKAK